MRELREEELRHLTGCPYSVLVTLERRLRQARWDLEAARLRQDRPVLGGKTYTGGRGESSMLFRPVKSNEIAWWMDEATCRRYNRALSKIRVRIEHVFARLKTFRVLRDLLPFRVGLVDTVFRALVVVHNMILETSADTTFT